jgi:choline dehydrogenase
VLCAGAIATPGILLRSGVGPRAEIERLGVDLVADVPAVAARLLDHPGVAIFLAPKKGVARIGDPLIQTTLRYRSASSSVPNDMQLQPGSFVPLPAIDLPGVSMMTSIGKPRGFGTIRFPTSDPRAKPRIDSRFLLDPDDLDKAIEAMELASHVVTSSAMRELATCALPTERGLMSRRAIRSWIHGQCGSGYHPCGTVPMGADDDPEAATDGRGRVRGVEGLIVADASSMPTVPSSNTNLPTIMIGERFGEWLREGRI